MSWMIALSLCILAMYVGLLIAGHLQSRKFEHWKSTTGKILSGSTRIYKNVPGDKRYDKEDTELREFPHVEYEYRVGETIFHSSRISQFTDPTDLPAEPTLTRYPIGSAATVYFDPADPKNAALERGHCSADYWILTKSLFVLLVVQWLLAGLLPQLCYWIKSHSATPDNAPFITGIACFGLFFLMLAIGVTVRLIMVWTWPSAAGRIKSVSLDSFHVSVGESYTTAYKPSLLYTYEVDGRAYQGDRVFLNFAVGGFSEQQSKKIVSRYRATDAVRVFYNPRKPGDSVLTRKVRGLTLFWMIASVFIFAAWYLAT